MLHTYPVHEMFHSFQGEGCNMGVNAFFVRLYGCPVKCPWCDSAGTWHPQHVPKYVARLTAESIIEEFHSSGARLLVVTGGEPMIHNLGPLLEQFKLNYRERRQIAIETSGAFEFHAPPPNSMDMWLTVSPKRWAAPRRGTVQMANEFKFIVECPEDIQFYTDLVSKVLWYTPSVPIWLHPEWSKRNDAVVLNAITKAVKDNCGFYRAGYQLHKLYNADARDPRAARPVPLGGDPAKGF